MKAKHTSSPWKIQQGDAYINGDRPCYGLQGPKGEWLGWLNKWKDDPKASAANARLIAAAPEMADFIAKLASIWEQNPHREIHREEVWGKNDLTVLEQARALLTK